LQLSLEILTGVCAQLPDPDLAPAVEDEGEMADQEGEEDGWVDDENPPNTNGGMEVEMASGVPQARSEGQSSLLPSLVPPLLELIKPTSLSFPPLASPSSHPPTTSALSAVHISAFECLNNIFFSLAADPSPSVIADTSAGTQVWNQIWEALRQVGTDTTGLGQERRKEVWELAVGVLWGLGNIWKGNLVPVDEQVNLLIQLCESTGDPTLKVKCIGTLDCLAQHPHSVALNKVSAHHVVITCHSLIEN
jgi:hypothetical protein